MLVRLIKSEIKKILKSKINILLLMVAILGTSAFVYIKYTEFLNYSELENQQGERLSGVDMLRYIDETRQQYAGEWSEEKAKTYLEDFQKLIEKHDQQEIDKSLMQDAYGQGYEELLKKSLNKELTRKELHDYRIKNDMQGDGYNQSHANDIVEITIYYKSNPITEGIRFAYGIYDENTDMLDNLTHLLVEKNLNLSQEKLQGAFEGLSQEDINSFSRFLQVQLDSLPNKFGSTVGNNMLISALDNCLWIPLICLMIILANTFGIERSYQMEQMIYPTKASKFKITIAKLMAGTLISVLTMIMTLIISILVGYVALPIHTWDIAFLGVTTLISEIYFTGYSYIDVLLCTLALSIVSSLTIAAITLALSYIIKNRFAVITILFIYFAAIIFINISNLFIYYSHPYTMTHIYSYLIGDQRLASLILGNTVIPYSYIVIVFWSVLIVITYIIIIIRSKMSSARVVS